MTWNLKVVSFGLGWMPRLHNSSNKFHSMPCTNFTKRNRILEQHVIISLLLLLCNLLPHIQVYGLFIPTTTLTITWFLYYSACVNRNVWWETCEENGFFRKLWVDKYFCGKEAREASILQGNSIRIINFGPRKRLWLIFQNISDFVGHWKINWIKFIEKPY